MFLDALASSTRFALAERFDASALETAVQSLAGPEARVVLIRDPRPHALRDEAVAGFAEGAGKRLRILENVKPNPESKDIMAMVETLDGGADLVIGIGGGSTLDSAKAAALLLANGGDLDEYLGPNPARKAEKRGPKLLLVPTTAGTGSEATKFGVYTSRSGRKYTLNTPFLQADAAILSPDLTYGMPPALTAATGIDALSHALEALWNKNATALSDRLGIEASVYVLRWLEKAFDSSVSGGTEGRKEMLLGACRAGITFNLTGTAAVHALSFIFSEEWHLPHGVACAVTLEDVLLANSRDEAMLAKIAKVGEGFFGKAPKKELAERLAAHIAALKKKLGLPVTFADAGIKLGSGDVPKLFAKAFDDPKMGNNRPVLSQAEVFALLEKKL